MTKLGLDRLKKACARARHPLARLSVRGASRNVPRGPEAAEVIEANHIDMIQQGAQPVDAPAISSRTKGIPVVNRIAPQLPLRAEVVGRNSGDEAGAALLVQQEE